MKLRFKRRANIFGFEKGLETEVGEWKAPALRAGGAAWTSCFCLRCSMIDALLLGLREGGLKARQSYSSKGGSIATVVIEQSKRYHVEAGTAMYARM